MYLDLYEGLGLTPEDLTRYDSPMVAFDGSIIMPAGMVALPMEVEGRKEIVHFIVVHSYSLYTAIIGLLWIHSMGTVPSSLHQKVKFPTERGIVEIREDQCMAQKCPNSYYGAQAGDRVQVNKPFVATTVSTRGYL